MLIWRQNKQTGSALLTALFIMTLVAIAATAMTLRLKLDITKMQLTTDTSVLKNKAQLPTFIGLQWLLQPKLPTANVKEDPAILTRFSNSDNQTGWQVSGEIIDLQSRFNINNLDKKENQRSLQNLLTNMGLDKNKARRIVRLCHYWTQPYRPGRGNDSLLNTFITQKPPYYPGFQPFNSPSELRLIPGVTSDIAKKLLPLMIALPNQTPLNIKTTSPELLKTLGNGLKESQVNRILELRNSTRESDKSALETLLKDNNIPPSQITTKESNYFLIISKVKHQDNYLKTYTIVERRKSKRNNKVKLTIQFVSYHTL